jgi:hypothetical protein
MRLYPPYWQIAAVATPGGTASRRIRNPEIGIMLASISRNWWLAVLRTVLAVLGLAAFDRRLGRGARLLQIVAAVRLRNVMGVPAGTVGHEAA